MFNIVPSDIMRKIFKIVFETHPLALFNLPEHLFNLADYTKSEVENLIYKCINENYEKTKIPLFQCENLTFRSKFFIENLNILNSVREETLYNKKFKIGYYFLNENFQVSEWLLSKENIHTKINIKEKLLYNSLFFNNIKLCKWIYYNNLQTFEIWAFHIATNNNNYEMLKWLYSLNLNFNLDECCVYNAVKNNNFEMLKSVCEKIDSEKGRTFNNFNCYLECVMNRNLEMLDYLYSKKLNISKSCDMRLCCEIACKNKDLKILKWLSKKSETFGISKNCIIAAIESDDIKIVETLLTFPVLPFIYIENESYVKICKSNAIRELFLNL
jgi:hypothetical protein